MMIIGFVDLTEKISSDIHVYIPIDRYVFQYDEYDFLSSGFIGAPMILWVNNTTKYIRNSSKNNFNDSKI